MITKSEIYDRLQIAKSRYTAFRDSISPEDRANAEAWRLAAETWQDIALEINTEEFQPSIYLDRLQSDWAQYVATGIIASENEKMMAFHAQSLHAAASGPPAGPPKKKGQKSEPQVEPEMAADDPRRFVDPAAIDVILADISESFGLTPKEFSVTQSFVELPS